MLYNLSDFMKVIPNYSDGNTIVYLQNWRCGFGSALACLIDNMVFLEKYNIKVKPIWNNNSDNFKYSNGIDDCFQEIFNDNLVIKKSNRIINVTSNIPHIKREIESTPSSDLKLVKRAFNNRFSIKQKYYDKFNEISGSNEITFSIHLRSNFQKKVHYGNNELNIMRIIETLHKKYGSDCTPFIATDVSLYLDYFLLYFPKAIYNKDCFRILSDKKDSVPQIKEIGIKHAEDVILDIIGLSKGKDIYMSESNFYIFVSYLIDDNKVINNISLM
jgi:hypothetical protein